MVDRKKVIKALECCKRKDGNECKVCPYTESEYCVEDMVTDALALLKEQEALKEKLLRNIADNQLAVSPTGYESEEEQSKRKGEWNGLQMAYEIVLNDGN